MKIRELQAQRAAKEDELRKIHETAETENRDLTPEEQTAWNDLSDEVETLKNRITRAQAIPAPEPQKPDQAPAHLRGARGDNFPNALQAFVANNDTGGVRDMMVGPNEIAIRASNNTDMNIGTAADGGDTVATGFYNQIIAKRSESSLAEKLGLQKIPGSGTTVDVPYDNEADGEFVSTSEASAFDQDAPALAKKSMTLVKYSKYITMSYELLQDTAVQLESFLANWVARGQAKTMNSLIVTEAAASGTAYNTTATNSAIAFGELESTALNATVADYLDDSPSVGWAINPATYATIVKIVGNPQYYSPTPSGAGIGGRELLGYPVNFSSKVATIASVAKVAYFGNWNYMGWREDPGFTLLRDPYSAAGTGQVKLWMYFRTVFKVLQADAIGYLKMKT